MLQVGRRWLVSLVLQEMTGKKGSKHRTESTPVPELLEALLRVADLYHNYPELRRDCLRYALDLENRYELAKEKQTVDS